ncbi:GNAT family N-acetyltransferase [Exiguobacterium qingdaonense]|uniref:GNAT family N-acetyltransferase n=1 Tax=Exiguobacterium qingdaonense TaxID=2751251 RepID=UPI001BE8DD1D|nr:GNAT family N-acetyltransferase [Exiguobacterium qingdaonense]
MSTVLTYRQNPPMQDLYRAFMTGFSDYIIPFQFDEQAFEDVFLVRDQNQPSRSIVAYDGGEPVGVVLSGIAHLDSGWQTRCGGLAVAPHVRKLGVATELMKRFEKDAKGTRLLEVIQGNDAALSLYHQLGYKTTREIYYFQSVPLETTAHTTSEPIQTLFDRLYPTAQHVPIWQCDVRVTQQETKLVKVVEDKKEGFLLYRNHVLLDVFGHEEEAEWLLRAAASQSPLHITLTSDRPEWIEAARRLEFVRDEISQFEMVKNE